MRATDGAIEACVIDKETMEPTSDHYRRRGAESGGSMRFRHHRLISELFRCGIINPKGNLSGRRRIRHDKYGMGSYVLVFQEDAGSVKDVEINEVDIDSFMRAKGAIFSAIRTMLTSLDFTWDMIDGRICGGRNRKRH